MPAAPLPIEAGDKGSGRALLAALAAALLVTLAGCDESDPATRRQRLHLPPPGFQADPEIGRQVFREYCIECHGYRGMGSEKGPPLVDPIYRPDHHADLAFHLAVRDGVRQHHWSFGDMPPRPEVTPEQTGHVIAYIRALQRREGIR